MKMNLMILNLHVITQMVHHNFITMKLGILTIYNIKDNMLYFRNNTSNEHFLAKIHIFSLNPECNKRAAFRLRSGRWEQPFS